MSNISGLLGTAGGFKGTGVDAPTDAVSGAQLDSAYSQNQEALKNQQNLLGAITQQNGLQNQSQVYNQLQGVVNGTGPNPAQAQLAQATAANTANQAALMAGQRGASQNTGLVARQAAMQGASNQQQSAGQAATLQAQQSLNALNQAGGMANTMASNQIGQTNTNTQAQQQEQSQLLGANAQQNAVRANLINATSQQQAAIGGGGASGAGSAMSMMGAEGGEVPQEQSAFAPQGPQSKFGQFIAQAPTAPMALNNSNYGIDALNKGNADLNKGIKTASNSNNTYSMSDANTKVQYNNADAQLGSKPSRQTPASMDSDAVMGAEGGKVDALLSPGEQYLAPKDVQKVKKGTNPLKTGERIPGKPKHPGNNYANDIVPKKLEPGGIVIPNAIMQSKNPHFAAMKFVHATIAKNRHPGKKK